nr:MAG TPA: hypothetical protein [Caudoviricetes sp.]
MYIVNKKRAHLYYQIFVRTSNLSYKINKILNLSIQKERKSIMTNHEIAKKKDCKNR